MSGFVYLIRNKDLYKIGITQNLEQRMKALKLDEILKTLQTENYEELERKLHKKYKDVRIPQTEYFRLTESQLESCKEAFKGGYKFEQGIDEGESDLIELFAYPIFFISFPILFLGGFVDYFSSSSGLAAYKYPALAWSGFVVLGSILLIFQKFFDGEDDDTSPLKTWVVIALIAILVSFNFSYFL